MREIESLEVYTVNAGSEVKSAENSEDLWKPSFAYLQCQPHTGDNRLPLVKIKISSFMFNNRGSHESIEWSLYKLSSSDNQPKFEFCVRCDGCDEYTSFKIFATFQTGYHRATKWALFPCGQPLSIPGRPNFTSLKAVQTNRCCQRCCSKEIPQSITSQYLREKIPSKGVFQNQTIYISSTIRTMVARILRVCGMKKMQGGSGRRYTVSMTRKSGEDCLLHGWRREAKRLRGGDIASTQGLADMTYYDTL